MLQKVNQDNLIIAPFELQHVAKVAGIMAGLPDGWGERGLKEVAKSQFYKSFVALQDTEVVGFCSYQTADTPELVFLLTASGYKRQGVAYRLLKETARLFDKVVLEVRSRNKPALSLYEKAGFKRIGVRKNMYSYPADDGIIMEFTPDN